MSAEEQDAAATRRGKQKSAMAGVTGSHKQKREKWMRCLMMSWQERRQQQRRALGPCLSNVRANIRHSITQWILPCQIDRTQRPVDHSHFDGVSFAAC